MKNLSLLAVIIFVIVFLVMIGGIINWLWTGFPLVVNTSGNSTIPLNEISAQMVPTLLNGITTATGIIIAFSIAVSGFLIAYVLKDDKRERDVIIVILSVFPLPMIFLFLAYLTLAGGQGSFGIAVRLGFVSLLYSLFALVSLFAFLSYRLYEREKSKEQKDNTQSSQSTQKPVTQSPPSPPQSNIERKKHFFDGSIFFYGLVVGLIVGTLGNIWASVSYDLAKTQGNFDIVTAFWVSTGCLLAVIIALALCSLFLWRKSRKA